MKRVLIYKDVESLEESKNALTGLCEYFQKIYDAFKVIDIEVSIDEIIKILSHKVSIQVKDIDLVEEVIKEKILDKIGEKQWNGVSYLKRDGLKALIQVPDITELHELLSPANTSRYWGVKVNEIIRLNMMEIKAGTIVKVKGADNTIADKFTHYSTTERGALLTESLHALCEKLNEWESLSGKYHIPGYDTSKSLPYVELRNGKAFPSLQYIRTWEKFPA